MVEEGLGVAVVVADRPCAALGIAEELGVPAELVERTSFGPEFDRDGFTHLVIDALKHHEVALVAMAGYGTIFSPAMQDAFGGRILNTHPALLPAFKGWHAVEEALAYGVKVTGCTVHVAALDVDTGGILADRSKPEHLDDLVSQGIETIDLVVCNLYPFLTEPSVETIDIGGPTMVRAAAKNHDNVGVVVDPADYGPVLDELRRDGGL